MFNEIEKSRLAEAKNLISKMVKDDPEKVVFYYGSRMSNGIKRYFNIDEANSAIIEIYPKINKVKLLIQTPESENFSVDTFTAHTFLDKLKNEGVQFDE